MTLDPRTLREAARICKVCGEEYGTLIALGVAIEKLRALAAEIEQNAVGMAAGSNPLVELATRHLGQPFPIAPDQAHQNAAIRLRAFIRAQPTFGFGKEIACRMLTLGDACECPLCDVDRLQNAAEQEQLGEAHPPCTGATEPAPAAPSETPRTKRQFYERVVEELNLDTRDPFTRLFANACALGDQRGQLEHELAAASAELAALKQDAVKACQ